MAQAPLSSINQSSQTETFCRLTLPHSQHPGTPKNSAAPPVVSSANTMSWAPGRPPPCPHNSRAGGWERELWVFVLAYMLRRKGQDIIRTWLFPSPLRSELEHGVAPWSNTAISGFIVDPDRKKMSKSRGNVVTPAGLLQTHRSDAVRYWAASSRLGTDAAFDPQNPTQVKIGRRLAIKVLNAAKFILGIEGTDASADA